MPETDIDKEPAQAVAKPEKGRTRGLLIELLFNIALPVLILSKFSSADYLGSRWGLVVALAFPLIYGVAAFRREGQVNIFSVIGFVSTLLTGGIGLLELDPQYIAIKEAAVPGLLCLFILVSIKTGHPIVKLLLLNERLVQVDRIDEALRSHQTEALFERKMVNASWIVALSFLVSSVLNYVLAKVVVVSQPGTEAFNEELAKMLALSFPVIALPATIIMTVAAVYIFKQIENLTDLKFEDIMNV